LTAAIVTKPAHGKLAVNPDGSFSYTPSASFTGTDSFTYTVSAGGTTSEPATVSIVIK
jgi:VCBS repeat-containing protein